MNSLTLPAGPTPEDVSQLGWHESTKGIGTDPAETRPACGSILMVMDPEYSLAAPTGDSPP